MFTVEDIMTRDPVALSEEDDLSLADDIFPLGRLRHLPVVRGEKLVGLVTHRDFLKALARDGEARGKAALAKDVMTRRVTQVKPTTSLKKALQLMVRNKFGCLPVVDDEGRLVGILTETDATRFAAQMIGDLDQIEHSVKVVASDD